MQRERAAPSLVALRRNLSDSLRAGALDRAAASLERLRREDPLSVHTRGGELELLLRQDRLAEASRLADQLVESFPASARIHYLAGRVAYRRRRYDAALLHLEESQRINRHWRTRHWLGKTLTQLGRLAEAESVLEPMVPEHPHTGRDLAWLYERMGDAERASQTLERYLERYPDDAFATRQLQRLRARTLDPDRLLEEVEALLDLGEPLPLAVFPEYVERLLRTGQGQRAREVVAAHEDQLDPLAATSLGWVCHRLQAPDLACRLFLKTLARNADSPKFRAALERDAVHAGCADEAITALREHAPDHRVLWGLIRRLERRESQV